GISEMGHRLVSLVFLIENLPKEVAGQVAVGELQGEVPSVSDQSPVCTEHSESCWAAADARISSQAPVASRPPRQPSGRRDPSARTAVLSRRRAVAHEVRGHGLMDAEGGTPWRETVAGLF